VLQIDARIKNGTFLGCAAIVSARLPACHIIQARIDKARDLLGQGDLDVKEVAARCGFDNEYYFSRLFRKVTGTTPSRYRSGKS
jgi:AraC family transcriptional regulator